MTLTVSFAFAAFVTASLWVNRKMPQVEAQFWLWRNRKKIEELARQGRDVEVR